MGYSLILCLPDTRMGSMFHLRFLFSDSFICDQAFYFGSTYSSTKVDFRDCPCCADSCITAPLLSPKKERPIVGYLLEGSQNIFLFQKYVALRDVNRNKNNNNDDDDAPPPLPPKSPKSPKSPKPKEETLPPPIPARNYQVRSGEPLSRISLPLRYERRNPRDSCCRESCQEVWPLHASRTFASLATRNLGFRLGS